MHQLLPPFCLLLALAMLITGFAMLAAGPPEESIDLHRARVTGDEAYEDVLESQFKRQLLTRKVLLAGLFGGSGLMAIAAFLAMRPSA